VTSLYEALDSSPNASPEQLQQAYRRAARRLHPDINPSPEADEAMRRLNDAWSVLGNPERRRRYDATIGIRPTKPAPESYPDGSGFDDGDAADGDRPRSRLLRPSFVVAGILAVIFVVTAYAAPSKRKEPSTFTTVPTPTSSPAANQGGPEAPQAAVTGGGAGPGFVGKCILRLLGYDAIVSCNQHGAQAIVAEVASTADCPPGTTVYQLEGRSQLVCLTPSGS
jgi:DnaJ domain